MNRIANIAFTGRPLDKDVGLQATSNRHYDTVGRWIDADHVGYQGYGELHRYPANRPE